MMKLIDNSLKTNWKFIAIVVVLGLVMGGGMLAYRTSFFQSFRQPIVVFPQQTTKTYCNINSDCEDTNVCTVDSCIKGTCTHSNSVEGTSCGATIPGESQTQFCNRAGKCVSYGSITAGPSKTDETANWQTYRSEEFGFEVRYPEDSIVRTSKGSIWIGLNGAIYSINSYFLVHYSFDEMVARNQKGGLSLEEWMRSFAVGRNVRGVPYKTSVGNLEAYRIDARQNEFIKSSDIYLMNDKKRIYFLSVNARNSQDEEILNQILSTFRFVEFPKSGGVIPLVIDQGDKQCIADEDCVFILSDCGAFSCDVAVNKKFKDKYEALYESTCKNYQGPMSAPCPAPVFQCKNNQCVRLK